MSDEELLALCTPIQGWMFPEELLWLFHQAKSRQIIVEIGVWKGRSTAALAAGTPGKVYGVDTWRGSVGEVETFLEVGTFDGQREVYEAALANLQIFIDANRCQLLWRSSSAVARYWAKPDVDMLFLDGSHDYASVANDLRVWSIYTAPGCLVCGHDRKHSGVSQAIEEFYGKENIKHGPGSIWYVGST